MAIDRHGMLHQPRGIPVGGEYMGIVRNPVAAKLELGAEHFDNAPIEYGSKTPWGQADSVQEFAPGITCVGTASHGGIKLSPERNKLIPKELRKPDGWYEEDIDAQIVSWTFPTEYARNLRGKYADAGYLYKTSSETIRDYYPDEWEAVTGQKILPGQSSERDRQNFLDQHKDSMLAVSAINSQDHAGMVEVTATRGGKRGGKPWEYEQAVYLVPAQEYSSGRNNVAFVVDPDRHQVLRPTIPEPPRAPRFTDMGLDMSAISPAQREHVTKEINKPYRWPEGKVMSYRELIESEGVSGKIETVDQETGSRSFYLTQRTHLGQEGASLLKVSKAAFDAMTAIPNETTDRDRAYNTWRMSAIRAEKLEREVSETEKAMFRSNSHDFEHIRTLRAKLSKQKERTQALREELEKFK